MNDCLDDLFKSTTPLVSKRGIHLDLNGLPPTAKRMVDLLQLFAGMRYNVVLVEWGDTFPWTVDQRFRSPTAFSTREIAIFVKTAADLGLELIPLVQCLGHMENPLSVKGYEGLREIPDIEAGLNPLAPGARELIQNMVDDVLALMPGVKHVHLGGDEARTFGKNTETSAYIEKHGKGALYLHHVEPILNTLNDRDLRPILWHDMMTDWDSDALTALAGKADLMPWAYHGDPEKCEHHCNTEILERFRSHGITLWGATAYKGAEGYDADIPDIPIHTENAAAWLRTAKRFALTGLVATAWSRYAVDTIQCNPIDACLDSALMVAVTLHDGEPPDGGVNACVDALASLDEKDRFVACRAAMTKLAHLRREGWEAVQHSRQLAVLGRIDERRTSARNLKLGFWGIVRLNEVVRELDELTHETRTAFDGLMESIWIEEYLATRIEPLREERNLIVEENQLSDIDQIQRLEG